MKFKNISLSKKMLLSVFTKFNANIFCFKKIQTVLIFFVEYPKKKSYYKTLKMTLRSISYCQGCQGCLCIRSILHCAMKPLCILKNHSNGIRTYLEWKHVSYPRSRGLFTKIINFILESKRSGRTKKVSIGRVYVLV